MRIQTKLRVEEIPDSAASAAEEPRVVIETPHTARGYKYLTTPPTFEEILRAGARSQAKRLRREKIIGDIILALLFGLAAGIMILIWFGRNP